MLGNFSSERVTAVRIAFWSFHVRRRHHYVHPRHRLQTLHRELQTVYDYAPRAV